MGTEFKWYDYLENSDEITQGDILFQFPFVRVSNYADLIDSELENIDLQVDIEFMDCIVLTQACDIQNRKKDMENIILCPIVDIRKAETFDKQKISNCIKGAMPQFYMLNKCDEFIVSHLESSFNYHIVDFNIIEKAPIDALRNFAKKSGKRLRLLPPYREHLSQAFAKYFMRIGLPSDIDKVDVYQSKGM